MSDNIVRMNQSFLDLYNEIEKGVSDIAQNIGRLPDEELTESKYKELSRRLDGIQVQFDRTSDAIKNLTLDQTNPELYEILEEQRLVLSGRQCLYAAGISVAQAQPWQHVSAWRHLLFAHRKAQPHFD